MQVGTLAIQHLFEKDVLYYVPLYQRPYVWNEEDQWQPLWDDLRRIAEVVQTGKQPRAHFLGASVQDHPAVPPGHIETRLVIDGQQRLTTIQLFLKAFEDVVRNSEDRRYQRALQKLTRNNHPLSTEPYEQFKIWPTNADREDFERVMECEDRNSLISAYGTRSDAKSVGRNIPDAYIFFHDAIFTWLDEPTEFGQEAKIASLYSAIRDNVRLVVIDLDEKDDAQLIFETLNARGTPLLASDLVKNSLLNELQSGGENPETAYKKYWQHFDSDAGFWRKETGRGHAKRARIEVFLQHALTLLTGEEVTAGHLYTAYRDYVVSDKAESPLMRLKALHKLGGIFKELQEGHENPRVQLFLERLHTMDIGTAYPFLLKLFELLNDNVDSLIQVLEDIESFLVRRMVCRLSTRGYNRLFVELIKALDVDVQDIRAAVRAALESGTAEFERWPDSTEFRKAWIENPLYVNLTRARLRLVLEALEMELRDKFAETLDVPKNLTVEHVMPQNWEKFWPLPGSEDEAESAVQRNRLLHTIGNLTLLNGNLNPSQSNKAWIDADHPGLGKRAAMNEHSVLFLNKQLCAYEQWNETTISERAEMLFELAKTIWERG